MNVQLADASDGLIFASVVVFFASVFAFAAERSSVAARRVRGRTEDAGPAAAGGAIATGMVMSVRVSRSAVPLIAVATVLLAAAMTCRGLAAGRVPWGNLYEFTAMAVLATSAVFLVVLRSRPEARGLGLLVAVCATAILGLAMTTLYAEPVPLMAPLRSSWLAIHVFAIVVAIGAFTLGAVASLAYLRIRRLERRETEGRPRVGLSSSTLDAIAYRANAFAYPLWTFAVVAGAIWAESAWGRYWGWDAKETWAFITWIVYSAYLHARATGGWGPRRAAMIAAIGYATVLFNFSCVNFLLTGLHSYAGV